MRKLLILLLIFSFLLVGCGNSGEEFEILLVNYAGDINYKLFN